MKNCVLFLTAFIMYFLGAMDGDQQTVPMQEMGNQHLDSEDAADCIVKLMREGKSVRALDKLTTLTTRHAFNREQLITLQNIIGKATPRPSGLPGLTLLSACSATALTIILSRNCVENDDCTHQSNSLFLSSCSFVMGSVSWILARKISNNYKEEFNLTKINILSKINHALNNTP